MLIIALDQDPIPSVSGEDDPHEAQSADDNLFLNYLSRIHREEDFNFILKGVTRLLMNPLEHTYLPHSQVLHKLKFLPTSMQKDPCRAIQSGVYVWGYLEKNCMLFIIFLAESSIPPRAVDLLLEVL